MHVKVAAIRGYLPFIVLPALCFAQAPLNLDFEKGNAGEVPPGWFVPRMLHDAGYRAAITREGCRTGACAVLTVPETRPPQTFGNLMSTIGAGSYRGKPVIFRAAVRVEAAAGEGFAALWLRVDRANGGMGFFDNMGDRPIRAGEWAFHEIRGTIDDDAQTINYGVMVIGNARAWVDDAELEVLALQAEGPEVTAAREAIRRLYARIDSANSTGDFDSLRAIATGDARFGTSLRKFPLAEAIALTKSSLGPASRLTVKTEIASFELAGGEARVRTRSAMTVTQNEASVSRENTNSDTWVRVDGAWRLKESLVLASREIRPPTGAATARAVAGEIRKRATPLVTVEAGHPTADLLAFGQAVGDARVVALGEATHGTREVFQMKHRLFEYLVREKGFTVFAIEANWPESEAADRYVKTGEGDPKAALAAMYFWTWQTEEVLALLEWMRRFNQAPGKHPVLSFTSFDMQTYGAARDRVIAYFAKHAPQDLAAVRAAYANLSALPAQSMSEPGFGPAAQQAETVVNLLAARRVPLTRASSPQEHLAALQMARIVVQATRLRAPGAAPSYRDQTMAQNVEWLLREAHPKEKIVLWAHNGHVSAAQNMGYRPMGSWLRESLGSTMYVLGFAIHTGSVRAMTSEGERRIGLAESPIPPAEAGTGTATLSAAGLPMFFLDLRTQTGALGTWLSQPHLFRTCGAIWDRANPGTLMGAETLARAYDGLVYLENTSAARGLEKNQ